MIKIYHSTEVKPWWLENFSRIGYQFQQGHEQQLLEQISKGNTVIFWETDWAIVHRHLSLFKQHKLAHPQLKVIIGMDHSFRYEPMMKRIDRDLAGQKDLIYISTIQYMSENYDNIKVASVGSNEYWCQHDIAEYVINKWIDKRASVTTKPHYFVFMKGMRLDAFRKKLLESFESWTNKSKCFAPEFRSDNKGYDRMKQFQQWCQDTFNQSNMFGGFGNGPPRFDYYDQGKIEIVCETTVIDDAVHFSEKLWRPIACKMPFVVMSGKATLNKFVELGYRLEPFEHYEEINEAEMFDKIPLFFKMCDSIINDKQMQNKLIETSEYNFNHFWNVRPKMFWPEVIKNASMLFGHCKVDDIYGKLLEI
jgi:hypothetical protein